MKETKLIALLRYIKKQKELSAMETQNAFPECA